MTAFFEELAAQELQLVDQLKAAVADVVQVTADPAQRRVAVARTLQRITLALFGVMEWYY